MKRISTWQQAYEAGTVTVDFGEGIHLELAAAAGQASNTARIDTLELATPAPTTNQKIISKMVAGHGWTAGPTTTATYNLNDTGDKAVGDRSLSITTNGTGGTGYIQKVGLNVDLSASGLVVWVKVNNAESIRSASLTLGNSDAFTPSYFGALPLTSGRKAPATEGEWFPVYFSFGNAGVNNGTPKRQAITSVRINLQDWAGTTPPTLKIGGIGVFSDKSNKYPRGVVSLAFDDSWASHADAAAKMAEHGFPGTEYLIQSRVNTAGNLSMAQVRMLSEAYGWEIGAHASNDAAHVDWTTQSAAWVDSELAAQKAWQEVNNLPTETFAYPIGPFTADIARQASKYYASARSTYPWTNSATKPHKFRLSCHVVSATTTLEGAKTWVDRAVANGGWPVFMFHNLVKAAPTGNDWLKADFDALVDYIAASGLPVATVGDVIRSAA